MDTKLKCKKIENLFISPYYDNHPRGPISSSFCDGNFTLTAEEKAIYRIHEPPRESNKAKLKHNKRKQNKRRPN